jgi:3'-5' exoribonuclease
MAETPALLAVRELKALENASGRPFAALVVVKRLTAKTASNGNPFLSLELGDRDGSFSCTVFSDSPLFDTVKAAGEGAVLRVEGKVEYYQDRFSPRITVAKVVPRRNSRPPPA